MTQDDVGESEGTTADEERPPVSSTNTASGPISITARGLVNVPDLSESWHTFRVVVATVTVVTGVILGAIWGWAGGFIAAMLAGIAVADAVIRRREPQRSALPAMLLDITMIGVAMVVVQLEPAGVGAPFIYMLVVPALLLAWTQAWWVMVYGAAWAVLALIGFEVVPFPDVATAPEVITVISYVLFAGLTVALVVVVSGALDRSRRSRDQFLASISHEIRTPLTSILGWSRLLRDEHSALGEADKDEALRLIESEATEVTDIVEELLTAAQLDSGALTVRNRRIDLREELGAVLLAKDPDPEEAMAVDGSAADAWADPLRVRQIIRNLLTNATRYGGEETWVTLSSDDTWCTLSVFDNGSGIPPELEHQVFDPFIQAGQARGTQQPIGLGLTVSRHLALLMGGELSYRRESGATRFELTLPVAGSAGATVDVAGGDDAAPSEENSTSDSSGPR
jgi:signal transduction histidine kinase